MCGAPGGKQRARRIKKVMSSWASLGPGLPLQLQNRSNHLPKEPPPQGSLMRLLLIILPSLEARKGVYRCIIGQKQPLWFQVPMKNRALCPSSSDYSFSKLSLQPSTLTITLWRTYNGKTTNMLGSFASGGKYNIASCFLTQLCCS